jgi:hypothetical protein
MKGLTRFIALGAVVAASASVASATVITANSSVPADGTINANPITILQEVVGGTMTAPTFTGTYNEFVYTDSTSYFASTCGNSCLTFVFTFSNNGPNANEEVSFGDAGTGFLGVGTNVGYHAGQGALGNVAPVTVNELSGGTINFNFDTTNQVTAGEGSDYLVIQTDATQYTTGFASVQDSTAANIDFYAPVAPSAVTPEPNSLLLLGTGLIGAAGMVTMRRRKAQGLL